MQAILGEKPLVRDVLSVFISHNIRLNRKRMGDV